MKSHLYILAGLLTLAACEKPVTSDDEHYDNETSGNVILHFQASPTANTRGTVTVGDYFSKLNVMLFDEQGEKAFDKVRTQLITDEGFGTLSMSLGEGTYTIVAVGHSSIKSATIKSPVMVQFTASDGQKLTDTFCYCGEITVGEQPEKHDLTMDRVSAMFRLKITDEEIPEAFARIKFDYTGGSANFNPTTSQGTTKSTQSEIRDKSGDTYSCYTFPYMADSGNLKIKVSALDTDGNVIRSRTFENVPMSRNRITTYTGHFFEEGDGDITQSGFGFTVNGEWEGEDVFEF